MKTIYLLRHAKSSWKDSELGDFDRPLNKRGRRSAEMIGRYLLKNGIEPAQILCSSSKRTQETLERMQGAIGAAVPTRFEKGIYMAEAPALMGRLRRLSDSLPSVMVIGHNPGMQHLAQKLAAGGDGEAENRLAEKFPTAGLAVITADIEHWRDLAPETARLDAFVRPRDLEVD